ncbi:MAG: hypothetical protein QOE90_3540 [Thermoplasmata archaeon]|nr:hypothetical protein [Thermoplasmata archaeon]
MTPGASPALDGERDEDGSRHDGDEPDARIHLHEPEQKRGDSNEKCGKRIESRAHLSVLRGMENVVGVLELGVPAERPGQLTAQDET